MSSQDDFRVMLPNPVRENSTWVIGAPGSGKSRALECWAMQDILAGRGVGMLDPAGDVFDHLLLRMAEAYKSHPEFSKKLVIVDPSNEKWTVGFNPLERSSDLSEELQANFFTDILIKVWGFDPNQSPRMVQTLNFSFLALLHLGLTIMDLPQFLIDADYRNEQMKRCTNPDLRLFFEKEYPTSQGAVQQQAGPVLNKIRRFVFNPDIRLMLTTKAVINFRKIMDEEKILLVNLSKGKIGEDAAQMLGAFIVANFQKAALSRADSTHRPRMYLYLDEFQNYTTDNIKDILAESRKYGLSLIMAHQFLDQLRDPILRAAVQNTYGTLLCFAIGYKDAANLAHEIFPTEMIRTKPKPRPQTTGNRVVDSLTDSLPFESQKRAFRAGWMAMTEDQSEAKKKKEPNELRSDELVTLLNIQQKTHFWMRRRGHRKPQKLRAFLMPDPPTTPEVLTAKQKLIDESMSRYGRLKADAKAEQERKPKRPLPMIVKDDYTDIDTKEDQP